MKVMCLTIPRSVERQERIKHEWRGFDVEFVFGLDWQDLGFDVNGVREIFGQSCCTAGHLKIWKRMIGHHDPFLIIEDDVVPLENIDESIERSVASEFPVVKLFHQDERDLEGVHPFILDGPESWIGTAAYVVNDLARLITHFDFWGPMDKTLMQVCHHRFGLHFPRSVEANWGISVIDYSERELLVQGIFNGETSDISVPS